MAVAEVQKEIDVHVVDVANFPHMWNDCREILAYGVGLHTSDVQFCP